MASLSDAPGYRCQRSSATRVGIDLNDARRCSSSISTVSRLIEPAIKQGEARASGFRLTPAGRGSYVATAFFGPRRRSTASWLRLSDAERETLLDLLARIIKANEARADKT